MKKLGLLFLAVLLVSTNLSAQEEEKAFAPTLNWSGFTHIWAGHVQSANEHGDYGFSVRYMRFKASGNLMENVKWEAQFAFDKGSPSILDVNLSYEPSDYFKVRFGQFPVPGAKSAVFSSSLWSTSKMFFNDRTAITQNWASNAGLKGYRSGGAMFYGNIIENKLHYYVMAAMPVAGTDNYFNPNVKTPVYENDVNGASLFSRLEVTPAENIELGVNFHTGKGISADTITAERGSYTLYCLMRQAKLFVMTEYIAGKNTTSINDVKNSEFSYNGYYIEVGYKFLKKYEPAIRFDSYTPDTDNPDKYGITKYNNVTLGFNYHPAKNIVLMTNYVIRMEEPETGFDEIDNNLFYVQLRYKFASKK